MTRIRLAAAAIILLGGLLAATASEASSGTDGGMCPKNSCWIKGVCVSPCPQ
jgi:hypothetical protein